MAARTIRRQANTGYKGQRDAAGLAALMAANREAQEAARLAYLKAHPEFLPCAVGGCSGLVGPAYQRSAPDGSKWGLCPRRDAHLRLMPEVFAPKPAA
jgi:hypothetical protein